MGARYDEVMLGCESGMLDGPDDFTLLPVIIRSVSIVCFEHLWHRVAIKLTIARF